MCVRVGGCVPFVRHYVYRALWSSTVSLSQLCEQTQVLLSLGSETLPSPWVTTTSDYKDSLFHLLSLRTVFIRSSSSGAFQR